MKKLILPLILFASVCRGYVVDEPILGVPLDGSHYLSRNLEAVWLFNDRPGIVGQTQDSSLNGHHGTLNGDAHSVPGRFGTAIAVDGSGNDYVETVDLEAIEGGTELTVIVWARIENGGNGFPKLVSKEHSGSIDCLIGRSGIDVQFYINSTALVSSGSDWSYDTWYQFVFRFRSGETNGKKIYLNGVIIAEATQTATINNIASALTIGDRPGGGRGLLGQIDAVFVYSRALSDREVTESYIDRFQMFEEERLPIASAPAEVGQVIMIMSSVSGIVVFIAFSFWISERKAA